MKTTTQPIKVTFNIQPALREIDINKPYDLWSIMGGSKSTPGTLFHGNIESIQFSTMERLLTIFRETKSALYEEMVRHLNASGFFMVEDGIKRVGQKGQAKSVSKKRAAGKKK